MYVNGENDTFYYRDAQKAFDHVKVHYDESGMADQVSFAIPENTIHELSTDLLLQFFTEKLMD